MKHIFTFFIGVFLSHTLNIERIIDVEEMLSNNQEDVISNTFLDFITKDDIIMDEHFNESNFLEDANEFMSIEEEKNKCIKKPYLYDHFVSKNLPKKGKKRESVIYYAFKESATLKSTRLMNLHIKKKENNHARPYCEEDIIHKLRSVLDILLSDKHVYEHFFSLFREYILSKRLSKLCELIFLQRSINSQIFFLNKNKELFTNNSMKYQFLSAFSDNIRKEKDNYAKKLSKYKKLKEADTNISFFNKLLDLKENSCNILTLYSYTKLRFNELIENEGCLLLISMIERQIKLQNKEVFDGENFMRDQSNEKTFRISKLVILFILEYFMETLVKK